ncbi:DEAD/DEAH box helicase [Myceligenerans xiligouense]|uniref:Superfamily II DNA/RNA helicase n=1 Tax=Myceligenerans xiligouense TaxID=253184 RepID=A0A3N4ZQC3_9MICO|nr:DEAD/DEAH box helicase [Myceligenerans xiligouense]RPF23185.1 superfamily II DNA/RNA helicase [Myceligenerans xiligouense]
MTTFAELGLPDPVVRSLADRGITDPFPIQAASVPDALAGRDVLGRGRTGSGKTLAFALPVVTRLAARRDGGAGDAGHRRPASNTRTATRRPRGLILCPTRELANQIDATLAPVAQTMGLRTTTIFGGVSQNKQVQALAAGVDVVVACPGRLEDLLGQGVLTLDGIEVTVLDEADHMADLGFLPGVKRILDRTPQGGQRLLFSATLDNGVDVLVKRYLKQPVTHSVDDAAAPPPQMTHHILAVADRDAKKLVVNQLARGTGRRVLFTRTKHQAKKLARQLTTAGVPAVDLHGNLGQGARERNLAAFTSGDVKVLVATDIAARGIHVDDIELVVHVDPPAEHKAYLHRSGRTARAGSVGDVVTVMLPEQRGDMRLLTRKAKITAQPRDVAPGDATVTALVGELAPLVERPETIQGSTAGSRPGGNGGAQGGGSRGGHGGGRSGGRRRARGGGGRSGSERQAHGTSASGAADGAAGNGRRVHSSSATGAPSSSGPGGGAHGQGSEGAPGSGRRRRRRGGRGGHGRNTHVAD